MIEAVLQYGFMQRALLAGMLLGILAPVIGVFLVLKRLSLIADALAHITLSGIAAGMLWNRYNPLLAISPVITGMGMSVVGALLVERVRKLYRFYQELAIPIILAAGLGVGVVLISLADGFNSDLFGYLFGSLSAVSVLDLQLMVVVTIIVLAVMYYIFPELLAVTFDEENAQLAGIPCRALNIIFVVLVALVIAVGMRVVGVLLISSMITLPVASSMQIANSFRQTLTLAVVFAQSAILLGMVLAYYLSWATGGTIVLVAVAQLGITIMHRSQNKLLYNRS